MPAVSWFCRGSQRARFETDDRGRFSGLLPTTGTWRVEVLREEPPLDSDLNVVVKPENANTATVELTLPDNRVVGSVVDLEGSLVPGARVTLVSAAEGIVSHQVSDAGGRFALRSAPIGKAHLSAESHSRRTSASSAGHVVEVPSEGVVGPYRLVLQPEREVKGRVLSPAGPVAGAVVEMKIADGVASVQPRTLSGPEGEFTLRLPASGVRAQVFLSPPGFAWSTEIADLREKAITLMAVPAGGTLNLRGPSSLSTGEELHVFLRYRGLLVPFFDLTRWAAPDELSRWRLPIEIPRVAPGPWELCALPQTALAELASPETSELAWLAAATCTAGALEPGGVLVLDLSRSPSTP